MNKELHKYYPYIYLNYDELLLLFRNNEKFKQTFIRFILKEVNNIKNNILNLTLTHYLLLTPLPTTFKSHEKIIVNENDMYKFIGKPSDNIITTNRFLPVIGKNPIPFTFGYMQNNNYILMKSNLYYYEITIAKNRSRSKLIKHPEVISIGYGCINNKLKGSHVGWQNNSIGYHSDDGKLFSANSKKGYIYHIPYGPEDTIGAGLIYTQTKNIYDVFFTLNGKLLPTKKNVLLIGLLSPQICLCHSHPIKINLGKQPYKFNLKPILYNTCNIAISTNNIFLKRHKIDNKITNYIKYYNNNYDEAVYVSGSDSSSPPAENVYNLSFNNILFNNNLNNLNDIIVPYSNIYQNIQQSPLSYIQNLSPTLLDNILNNALSYPINNNQNDDEEES